MPSPLRDRGWICPLGCGGGTKAARLLPPSAPAQPAARSREVDKHSSAWSYFYEEVAEVLLQA